MMIIICFSLGCVSGYLLKNSSLKDEARKFGVLNIGGYKFVRFYEVKDE